MGNPMQGSSFDTSSVFEDPGLFYDDFDVERFLQDLERRERPRRPVLRVRRLREPENGPQGKRVPGRLI
ncbi:MAG TPA: hypothetical protein VIN61_02740 [Gammaproteobacteria bacterium]